MHPGIREIPVIHLQGDDHETRFSLAFIFVLLATASALAQDPSAKPSTIAPHKYSASEQFVREPALPEDVVEQQKRVSAIFQSVQDAVAQHDFAKARQHSDEERIERDKLRSLYQRHGLLDWLYE